MDKIELRAKVTHVESASRQADGVQRMRLQVSDADSLYNELKISNPIGLLLDEEVVVTVKRVPLLQDTHS